MYHRGITSMRGVCMIRTSLSLSLEKLAEIISYHLFAGASFMETDYWEEIPAMDIGSILGMQVILGGEKMTMEMETVFNYILHLISCLTNITMLTTY